MPKINRLSSKQIQERCAKATQGIEPSKGALLWQMHGLPTNAKRYGRSIKIWFWP